MSFSARYNESRALIVGIDRYPGPGRLDCAKEDAVQVARALKENFNFPESNVVELYDEEATRGRIFNEYCKLIGPSVDKDDRVVVYFAGHGHTVHGFRGDVGFLVPFDGDSRDISTLISWDELTRKAGLIAAKHVWFVIDACYGGLALHRKHAVGSSRFLRDVLLRYSRQVLTAGKADQVVSDAGGPKKGHSMFTGFFLEALEGKAVNAQGIMTANTVMNYVYNRVSVDRDSIQSPHFGFLDGDGDMVLNLDSVLEALDLELEKDGGDLMIDSPISSGFAIGNSRSSEDVALLKEYLSESRYKIRLDDFVREKIKDYQTLVGDAHFPVEGVEVTAEQYGLRLEAYEHAADVLLPVIVLLAKWGESEHRYLIDEIVYGITEPTYKISGITFWVNFRWYPVLYLLYAGGIGALAAGSFDNLYRLFMTIVSTQVSESRGEVVYVSIEQVGKSYMFKDLAGFQQHKVPRSEYMMLRLQSRLEALLGLGGRFENVFDKFEVLLSLVYADIYSRRTDSSWAPPGRFAWKMTSSPGSNPFEDIVSEADAEGTAWAPLSVGFFNRSKERLDKIVASIRSDLQRIGRW